MQITFACFCRLLDTNQYEKSAALSAEFAEKRFHLGSGMVVVFLLRGGDARCENLFSFIPSRFAR